MKVAHCTARDTLAVVFTHGARSTAAHASGRPRVVMLLENQPYPRDVRVRLEAESLGRAGYEVRVIAPRAAGQPRRETIAGVGVRRYRLPMGGRGALGYLFEYLVAHVQLFARAVAELLAGADVVHLHNPPDTLFPVALLARALGRRAVFDQHDLFPELLAERLGSARLTPLAVAVQRAAARAASLVLVTNESQRELLLARSGREPDSVMVVRNGPPRTTLAAPARAARDGALAEPRLVYLGELAPQDGVSLLPELLRAEPLARARLTVVGDGPLRPELEREVTASPDLAQRVRFTGYVDHGRVPQLLAEADVAIDPAAATPFNDVSTMTKIAEYLAAGLPVVAFDLTETRRTGGDAALYARDGDLDGFARAVAELAADPERRCAIARAARARAEALVWEHSEQELIRAYALLQELP